MPFGEGLAGYFEPREEDWRMLEAAYGNALPDVCRRAIAKVVAGYLEEIQLDRPSYEEAEDTIATLRKSAKDLIGSLPGSANSSVDTFLLTTVSHQFVPSRLTGHNKVESLREVLLDLIVACDRGSRFVKQLREGGAGLKPSEAWDRMARQVLLCLRESGLPDTTWYTEAPPKASPTVLLFTALQALLPEDCRQHTQSGGALAHVLKRLRRVGQEAVPNQ
jgi:hypothetical protein